MKPNDNTNESKKLLFPSLPDDFGEKGVSVFVECVDEILKLPLQAEQWAIVRGGGWFHRKGPRWYCDDAFLSTSWSFSSGGLTVEYGRDGGIAFEGDLDSVSIVEKGKRGLTNENAELRS